MSRQALRYAPTPGFLRTDEPLLWFAGSGHETRVSKSYYYDAAQRVDPEHVVLQVTLAGQGFYQPNSSHRELLGPGRAFIDVIPGPFEYGYAGHESGDTTGVYEHVFISIAGPAAIDWTRRIHAQFGPILDFGEQNDIGENMLTFLQAAASGVFKDRYQFSSQLYGLLMQVFSTLTTSRVQRAPLVSRAIQTIDLESHDPRLSVLTLSNKLDCSREHLTREFKRTLGISPLAYLTQQRVRAAARELRSDPSKLDLIAKRSGFSSAGYLCRVFRQVVGVTPAQFRARPWMVGP